MNAIRNRPERLASLGNSTPGRIIRDVRREDHCYESLIVPDPKTLKPGDRIRILRVPVPDLHQREREIASGTEMPGWTADTIERIIAQTPIVQIERVDDDGCVWYETELIGRDGDTEHHSLIIYNDDTWEHATVSP